MTFYKKALELDPDNDTYKSNMKIAEDKMDAGSPVNVTLCVLDRARGCESARPRVPCVPCVCVCRCQMAATGGVDLAGLLSNPGFMNMVRPPPQEHRAALAFESLFGKRIEKRSNRDRPAVVQFNKAKSHRRSDGKTRRYISSLSRSPFLFVKLDVCYRRRR